MNIALQFVTFFQKTIHYIADFCMPPQCLGCKTLDVSDHKHLCSKCWDHMTWTTAPLCNICGKPSEYGENLDMCDFCENKHFTFSAHRSVVGYGDISKHIVLGLKHNDQTLFAKYIAGAMAAAHGEFIRGSDIIIPIPLHYKRLLWRQFNQSGLISNHMSKLTKLPVCHHTLYRNRYTAPQGSTEISRKDNVDGVFDVENSKTIQNKTILLVDDVFTSGATVNAAAKSLLKFGAKDVRVITFAHVLKRH